MRQARPYRLVRSTNSTDADFPSKVPTKDKPSGDGVIELSDSGFGPTPCWLVLLFFGTDANDEAFDARVIGWRRVLADDPTDELWVPTPLVQVAVTLGNIAGIAGTPVDENQFLADTLALHGTIEVEGQIKTLDGGGAGVDTLTGTVVFTSPANDLAAHMKLLTEGFELIEVTFDLGTAASANALYTFEDAPR